MAVAVQVSGFLVGVVVQAITWYRTWDAVRAARSVKLTPSITYMLLRDGASVTTYP